MGMKTGACSCHARSRETKSSLRRLASPLPRATDGQPVLREDKLILKDVPVEDPEEFARWLYQMRVQFAFSCGGDPAKAWEFLNEIHATDVSFADLHERRKPEWARPDIRLFLAVLFALKGSTAAKYHLAIQNQCREGAGRQAIRVLMQSISVNSERLSMAALQELQGLACSRIQDLEGVIAKFEQLRLRARLRPVEAFEHLRRLVKPISQCNFVLQTLLHEPASDDKADRLISSLHRIISD